MKNFMMSIFFWAIGLMTGFSLGTSIPPSDFGLKGLTKPIELSDNEKDTTLLYIPTIPIDIELRIVPRKEYDELHPRTAGISYTKRKPCRIEIPDGWNIMVSPDRKRADWINRDDGDTLAHEILHCIHGGWHK